MNAPIPTDQRPSLLPAVIGILLMGVVILVLGFWVSSRPASVAAHPTVTLISPSQDTSTAGPLTLRFTTSHELELLANGWGTGRYHLHAMMGSRELMPAAADIRRAGEIYEWTLPAPDQSVQVQLVWSLQNHQRQSDGASRSITITPQ